MTPAEAAPSPTSVAVSARMLPLPRPSSPRAASRTWRRRPVSQPTAPRSPSSTKRAAAEPFRGPDTPTRPSPTGQRSPPTRPQQHGRLAASGVSERGSAFPGLMTPAAAASSPTSVAVSAPTLPLPRPSSPRAASKRWRRRPVPQPTAPRSPSSTKRAAAEPFRGPDSPTRPSPTGQRSPPTRPRGTRSRHRSVKIKFSSHQLMKHHCFMLCKFDKKRAVSLASFIKDEQMVKFVISYGIKRTCNIKGRYRITSLARDVIKGVTVLVYEMLRSGYSLVGKLSIRRLYILPATTEIKLVTFRRGGLHRKNKRRAEADWNSVENIIRRKILKGVVIPSEVKWFLELLKDDPTSHEDLIRYNICLMDDTCKIFLYQWMYETLRQIKAHNKANYDFALTCIKSGQKKWLAEISGSWILETILNFKDPNIFSHDSEGLLLFGRHSTHHMMDYSVESDGTILFTQADQFCMLEMFVPGLFSELQEAMFAIKKLETLQVTKELQKSHSEDVFLIAALRTKD